jgi:nucleotide-binding universal stress UspA family protein
MMNWQTIVVGIDDTEASKRALERAADIAFASKAKLVVTSVAPVLAGMAAGHGIGPWDPADPPEAHQIELLHAKDYLAERNIPAEVELGIGEPAEAVVSAAEKHEADLIVVGTREPGFLGRLLAGSVSQAVARKAHCDVLIVHE